MLVFFKKEDGIRDGHVTGVQTCALPMWRCARPAASVFARRVGRRGEDRGCGPGTPPGRGRAARAHARRGTRGARKIGRASCRERVRVKGGEGCKKVKRSMCDKTRGKKE